MTAANPLQSILTFGASQIGVPYSYGGNQPGLDLDCSALTMDAYNAAGITIPRTSEEQFATMTPVTQAQAVPGDLVFFAGSDGTLQSPGHVGIYLGGNQYLDAPYTGANVRIDTLPPANQIAGFRAAPGVAGTTSANPTGEAGQITTGVLNFETGGLYGDASGAAGLASDADSVLHDVTSGTFWKRVGMGYLGAALIIVGFVVFFESTDTGTKATSDAAMAAIL